MAIKLRPLYDRVLVRRDATKTNVQVNGVFLPDSAVERPEEGEVIAVGKGHIKDGERIPIDVVVGQRVLFGKYSGNEAPLNGETLLLLREDELLAGYEESGD